MAGQAVSRKMLTKTPRIRKSFDLTELALDNLMRHSQVTGTPVVGIINLLAERVLPNYTKKAIKELADAEAKMAQAQGGGTQGQG